MGDPRDCLHCALRSVHSFIHSFLRLGQILGYVEDKPVHPFVHCLSYPCIGRCFLQLGLASDAHFVRRACTVSRMADIGERELLGIDTACMLNIVCSTACCEPQALLFTHGRE